MKITFWANIFSPHLVPMVRSIQGAGCDITMVVEQPITPKRAALGWEPPDLGEIHGVVNPDKQAVSSLVQQDLGERVHIFAGVRHRPLGARALKMIIRARARWGFLSESADPRGVRGLLRRCKYKIDRMRSGKTADFVLAMGSNGVRWFERAGYDKAKIFEFAYSVEHQGRDVVARQVEHAVKILYVGQLIQRKAVDSLLEALTRVDGPCRLGIVGSGVLEQDLKSLSVQLGVDHKCEWLGSMPASKARAAMESADILVLPSHHDGWGAVVNEALSAGTVVVCSEQSGAASLVHGAGRGAVVQAGDVGQLARALSQQMSALRSSGPAARLAGQAWAECISPRSMAKYFQQIMQCVYEGASRPIVPWCRKPQ